ncbi:hypothetical protein LMF89_22825 [Pelosinus sp. Bkl1]|uniref:Uncharacterized protein n=2 Tax=Pelosinus baikalensis TaxID=2892015 RepID=A0ABS8HYT3_9FIRM|nr:hypothetical protein [Pelosinus baikalensis]
MTISFILLVLVIGSIMLVGCGKVNSQSAVLTWEDPNKDPLFAQPYIDVDETFSFQAKDFYIKLDYKEVFTLEQYPITGKRHYFVKQLS